LFRCRSPGWARHGRLVNGRRWPATCFWDMVDLTPFMVLLVAMSGRNIETIKELPALHTVLEGRAVQLQLVKRRRGAQHWKESVTWEIGPPGAELTTAGGCICCCIA